MEVIVLPHTHWDREWYRTYQDFRIRLIDVMDKLITDLESGRLEYFYLDGQSIILEDYFEIYPEKRETIEKLIMDKKLFIGPWYVLADEFLVTGESLMRNIQIGMAQAKAYGCVDLFGYLPDSFGHNSEMPRILSSFGLKNAVLWRGTGERKSEFIWESNDGSSVLVTYLTEGYFITGDFDESIEKIKKYSISNKVLLPVGGDHIYLTAPQTESKIFDYFSNLEKFRPEIETVKGELRDNTRNPILPGTLSTRNYLKQHNARSTWRLSRLAEPMNVFSGKDRKRELDYAWKLLLKNHPHDSICGCSIDEVHQENVSRYKQVDQISSALIERCLPLEKQNNSIVVYNMGNYAYSGVVKLKQEVFARRLILDTGKAPMSEDIQEVKEELAYVENIPAFSVRTISPAKPPKPMEITQEIIDSHVITDRRDVGDSYNYCPVKGDKPEYARLLKKEVIEQSEYRNIVRVHYWLNADITTNIITTAGSRRVEFITSWENTAKDHIIQVKFELPEKIYETISENTFGLIKRSFDPDYRIEDHMPAAKGVELKTNSAPLQRFVYAQGLGVITEGLHEYVVSGNTLLITLLRSTEKLSKVTLGTRNFPAGPPLDTPGAQCLGRQTARYAICRPNSPEELFKEADEFMGCTLAEYGSVEDEDFLCINNPDIVVYGVQYPENGKGIIVRAFNLSGTARSVSLKSEIVEFKPYELKTLWLKTEEREIR